MRIMCEYCGREIRQVANGTDKIKKAVCNRCKKENEKFSKRSKKVSDWAKNIIPKTLYGNFKEEKWKITKK